MTAKSTSFDQNTTLNCCGKLLNLERLAIMGIINLTPDSFYEGSRHAQIDAVLHTAEKMLTEGADILDMGGMSSRPGAPLISPDEEMQRLLPAVEGVSKRFPNCIISVDTVRAKVAQAALEAGAGMVNDISAGEIEPELWEVVAKNRAPYVLMHMRGLPENMQQNTQYDNITEVLLDFFTQKIANLHQLGIYDIVLDPGFGFGKSLEQNYELLRNLHQFTLLGFPVLAGISRKSMVYKALKTTPENALNGTTAAHTIALLNGAKLLRVHDVKEAMELRKIVELTTSL